MGALKYRKIIILCDQIVVRCRDNNDIYCVLINCEVKHLEMYIVCIVGVLASVWHIGKILI